MEAIAIIGIGCRFPGAQDTSTFWQSLCDGVDAISEIPPSRWDLRERYDSDPEIPGKMNSRYGGFLPQVDQFDPHFFGISPREAVSMDPQQRLLLEVAWESLEDAGQVREQLAGSRTGVFVGMSTNDYSRVYPEYVDQPQSYDLTGNALNIAAGRVSYLFNLRGPSLVVDTACSSSLVAVHLACQSLWNGESTLALAAGVNIILSPIGNMGLTKLKALSSDGRCKTFDARANGYVRSEGAGCVVLKPLSQALADNDPIYATVRGSAINHDGRSNGLTVPSGSAQEAVIREALTRAKVLPSQISYVEAHGTGTSLGDPIEAIALGTVLSEDRLSGNDCAVGAVKSNIGHLEAAAGIASLIKVALALKHQQIPPSLHFQTPNPYIPFNKLPLRVQQSLTPWFTKEKLAKAGVSSFGFSGTNAHVVLEQAPQPVEKPVNSDRPATPYLLPLSAHCPEAVKSLAKAYQALLAAQTPNPAFLQNLCYTASVRRSHHKHRLALLAHTSQELQTSLQTVIEGALDFETSPRQKQKQRRPKVTFVFPEQGFDWWTMGRDLLQQEPVFQAILEQCDRLICSHTDWSLLEELTVDPSQSRLDDPAIAQPIIFALQIALTQLWRFWGIEPTAVVGCGLAEVAAAHIAGVLNLAEAVQLVCQQSQLLQKKTPTESITRKFIQALSSIEPQPGTIPLVSTVTGQFSNGSDRSAAYWESNLNQPAYLAPAIDTLIKAGQVVFLEISPYPTLSQCIAQRLQRLDSEGIVLPNSGQGRWERAILLNALGTFYGLGHAIEWHHLYPSKGKIVTLPTYPWQRERYWVKQKPYRKQAFLPPRNSVIHPLLGQQLHAALQETLFESELSLELQPFLVGHQVYGVVVLPAAAYLEIALAAGAAFLRTNSCALQQVFIQEALTIPEDVSRTVQLILTPSETGEATFRIVSLNDAAEESSPSYIQHATGRISSSPPQPTSPPRSLANLQTQMVNSLPTEDYYQHLRKRGLEYGSSFQGIEQLWWQEGAALGKIRLPATLVAEADAYQVHPVLLDAGFQLLFATLSATDSGVGDCDTYLPVGLDSLRIYHRPGTQLWIHGQMSAEEVPNSETRSANLQIFDDSGQLIAEIEGLQVRRVRREMLLQLTQKHLSNWLYEIEWQSQPRLADPEPKQVNQPGSWLLFADQGGMAAALAKRLESYGETCILVFPGEAYEILETGHWQINPARVEDFRQLFQQGLKMTAPLRGVVHFWGLENLSLDAMTAASLKTTRTLGCGSVLHLVQELAHANEPISPRLWLITRGTQPVTLSSSSMAQTSLWGLGRVIALEHPQLWGGLVDLDVDPAQDDVSLLLAEIWQSQGEDHLAFRDGQRYVARLIQSQAWNKSVPGLLRQDGTYLITGGLGSLGLKVAQWMVEQGARHLVLVGRRGGSCATRVVLSELEQAGANIWIAEGDVTQERDLSRILEEIKGAMPSLRGIIHAAGVLEDGLLIGQNWGTFDQVMAPKVEGAWNLHLLTQDMPLDFFVLFSSIASLLGSPGQGNYAAANAFLDALAHYRQGQGLPALSINWGPWAETGMAANLGDRHQQRLSTLGVDLIASKQGLQVLGQLLPQSLTQVGVLPVQWSQFLQHLPTAPPMLAQLTRASGLQTDIKQLSAQQLELIHRLEKAVLRDRHKLLLTHLQDQVIQVLRLSPAHSVDPHQGFFDLGMDSLTSVELKNRLQAAFGRPLPSTLIFDYPTLDGLARYLVEELFPPEPTPVSTKASEQTDNPLAIATLTELESLSEEDAETLLLQELASISY